MNKDQIKGRVEQATGAIKEAAGKVVGNPTLEVKGKVQNHKGRAQAAVGDIKSDLSAAVEKVKSAAKRSS